MAPTAARSPCWTSLAKVIGVNAGLPRRQAILIVARGTSRSIRCRIIYTCGVEGQDFYRLAYHRSGLRRLPLYGMVYRPISFQSRLQRCVRFTFARESAVSLLAKPPMALGSTSAATSALSIPAIRALRGWPYHWVTSRRRSISPAMCRTWKPSSSAINIMPYGWMEPAV